MHSFACFYLTLHGLKCCYLTLHGPKCCYLTLHGPKCLLIHNNTTCTRKLLLRCIKCIINDTTYLQKYIILYITRYKWLLKTIYPYIGIFARQTGRINEYYIIIFALSSSSDFKSLLQGNTYTFAYF